ncbi:hypothetical protein QBC42DRAFT_251808 [Cladorrhinum samala]|uniref:Uncharacterized protein n=1 Tax=Cladorrhinum samala TaxID=585594 RepID=A0AAV9HMQ4_9PEZI|nr:hypothetical protein QBC42DRAFT_251808 [Cladorrhinum samala]
MARRLHILDSTFAAGRPLLESRAAAAGRINMPPVRAAELEIEADNSGSSEDTDNDTDAEPEEHWDPAPDEIRASTTSIISHSAVRPVAVTAITTTTRLPASALTPTFEVPSHGTSSPCLPIRSTARSPVSESIRSRPGPPIPLIVATTTTTSTTTPAPAASQPTPQQLPGPTTFLTLTVTRDELGGLPAATGPVGPDGANPGSAGAQLPSGHGSNLLKVGGSTVLAGAVITAGIFLLVRYAMKVRQRKKWESDGGEEEEGEEESKREKNSVAAVGVGLQQQVVSGPAAAAQVLSQAGAHHAGFL